MSVYAARWAALAPPRRAWARHAAIWALAAVACAWVGHGAAVQWLRCDTNWTVTVYAHLWVPLGCAAAAMVLAGWRRLMGDRPHCRRCRYEKAEASGPVCPECGGDWSEPRGVVLGVPRWGHGRLVAGIVVLTSLWPAWVLVDRLPKGRIAAAITAQLPTDVLIVLVAPEGASGHKDVVSWSALLKRRLSPRQEAWLARRLLASRRWHGTLSNIAEPWMLSAAAEGRLPEELREAYFEGMARPVLTVSYWPESPGAEVSIGGEYRPMFSRLSTATKQQFESRLYVSEFRIARPAAGGGEEVEVVPVYQRFRLGDPAGIGGVLTGNLLPKGSAPSVRVALPETGSVNVSATVWVVYVTDPPVTSPPQAEWNADGTPRLPEEVLWARKMELSVRVERERR